MRPLSISWIGVSGLERAEICARLKLVDTRRPSDVNEGLLSIAERPNGWTIIHSSKFAYFSRRRLADLSQGAEVVSVDYQPNVMVSGAEAWRDGESVWSVTHQLWNGVYDLDAKGEPPACLAGIHEQQRRRQDEAGGLAADHDLLVVVPLLVGRDLCGYYPGEPPFPHFSSLEPARSPLRALWNRVLKP
jgi:hypothetical protein